MAPRKNNGKKLAPNQAGEGSLSPAPSSTGSTVNEEDVADYMHLYSASARDVSFSQNKGPRSSLEYEELLKATNLRSSVAPKKRPKRTKVSTVRRLPPLESFEKSLEFKAQAPTRVLLRLERLMGTERVNITNPRYMKTFHSKLLEDENEEWRKRKKMRMKGEDDRFRKLAIAGLVDPGTDKDMADLQFHPVFRVNRVLDRLAKIDRNIFAGAEKPTRPIKAVEPFEEYARTGLLFPHHPHHYMKPTTIESGKESHNTTAPTSQGSSRVSPVSPLHLHKPHFTQSGSLTPVSSSTASEMEADRSLSKPTPPKKVTERESIVSLFTRSSKFDGEEEVKSSISREEEQEMELVAKKYSEVFRNAKFDQLKAQYGIDMAEDLHAKWKRHRSPLLEMLEEQVGVNQLFDASTKLLDTFKREQIKAEVFCRKSGRI